MKLTASFIEINPEVAKLEQDLERKKRLRLRIRMTPPHQQHSDSGLQLKELDKAIERIKAELNVLKAQNPSNSQTPGFHTSKGPGTWGT